MGCDIHAYLEYYDKDTQKYSKLFVNCLSENIQLGRDYVLFNLLAGVRGYRNPIFMPRGIPKNLSYTVSDKFFLKVVDSVVGPNSHYPATNYIFRQEADDLVREGKSKYYENDTLIADPAWHTPSWLNKNELIEIRKRYLIEMIDYETSDYIGKRREEALDKLEHSDAVTLMKTCFPSLESVGLNAVIASMIAIENTNEYESRLVFWFDS